jgi:hypothetical protein
MKVLVDTSVWSLALRHSATAILNTEQQHAALGRPDYEKSAEVFNICRAHGVQGSNTDFLNFEKYVVLMRHG